MRPKEFWTAQPLYGTTSLFCFVSFLFNPRIYHQGSLETIEFTCMVSAVSQTFIAKVGQLEIATSAHFVSLSPSQE